MNDCKESNPLVISPEELLNIAECNDRKTLRDKYHVKEYIFHYGDGYKDGVKAERKRILEKVQELKTGRPYGLGEHNCTRLRTLDEVEKLLGDEK